jgi:hypothetical protein
MYIKTLLHASSITAAAAQLFLRYFIAPSMAQKQFNQYTAFLYLIVLKFPV